MRAEQSLTLLENVRENARGGLEAVRILMERTNDPGMLNELRRQEHAYQEIGRRAQEEMRRLGARSDPADPLEGAGMGGMRGKAPSHIAGMLIQGSALSIRETTKAMGRCPDAGENAKAVAWDFLREQQKSIDSARTYL